MFAVDCSTSVAREGRSELASGLQFFPHPESSFQTIGRSSAQPTPTLTHSAKRSTSEPPPPSILHSASVLAMQTVKVIKFLRPGYLWDFWLADHSQYGKVVLKLVYLPNYPCNRPDYDDYVPPEEVITEALKEEGLYLGPLNKLQGELVPKYYGLYHSVPGSYHIAMLLEYAGHAIGPGEVDLDEEWKEKLYSAYQRLHRHGVVHRDDLKDEDDVGTLMSEAVIVRTRIGPESLDEIYCDSLPAAYYSDLENPESFLQELRDIANAPLPDWVIEHNRRLLDLRLPPSDDIIWEDCI
ncbi:uncharacterized protein L199_007227 [Kwoniella botswanensis]|uniref:uncharacterized protein n=1 Tax=Kwoniella botswanensis TaxID=1268659 RepID=UPI00315D2108